MHCFVTKIIYQRAQRWMNKKEKEKGGITGSRVRDMEEELSTKYGTLRLSCSETFIIEAKAI